MYRGAFCVACWSRGVRAGCGVAMAAAVVRLGCNFAPPCSVAADEVGSSEMVLAFGGSFESLGLLGGKLKSALTSSIGCEICGDVGLVGGKVEYALFVSGITLHYRFG